MMHLNGPKGKAVCFPPIYWQLIVLLENWHKHLKEK